MTEFIRDGHKLRIVRLRTEAWPEFEIVCPGNCHLWAVGDNDKERQAEPCWLRYWWKEDSESAREAVSGSADGSGPYDIGWYWNGEYIEFTLL